MMLSSLDHESTNFQTQKKKQPIKIHLIIMLAYNTQLGIKYIGKKKASTYHLSHDHHFTRKITTKFPKKKKLVLAYNTQLGIKYIGKKKASTYHLSHDHHFTRKITTKFPSLKTHKGQAHTHYT